MRTGLIYYIESNNLTIPSSLNRSNMERILTIPVDFPNDSSLPIGNDFPDFYAKHIDRDKVPFDGLKYLRDIYVSRETIENILKNTTKEECAGFVFYCARVEVEYPKDSGKKEDRISMAVVGVDNKGILRNRADQGACYVTRPCPPYCDSWGI